MFGASGREKEHHARRARSLPPRSRREIPTPAPPASVTPARLPATVTSISSGRAHPTPGARAERVSRPDHRPRSKASDGHGQDFEAPAFLAAADREAGFAAADREAGFLAAAVRVRGFAPRARVAPAFARGRDGGEATAF